MIKFLVSIMVAFMLCLTNFGIINCQARQSGVYMARSTDTIYASVVHVSDGDTITVQTKYGKKIKVRLYAIDAPEKAQPYGPQSTGILKRLVLNEFVTVEVVDTDRYGRKVGRVYLNRQDMNAEMIRLGAAWHYRYYDKSAQYNQYEDIERCARNERRGLWNRDNPMPPWEYRKMMREQGRR